MLKVILSCLGIIGRVLMCVCVCPCGVYKRMSDLLEIEEQVVVSHM